MVAALSVGQNPDNRPPLVCTCRIAMVNGLTGEVVPVRGYSWKCPSCGLDKKRALVQMCVAASSASGHYSFLTLTHRPADAGVALGEAPSWETLVAPEGFDQCDPGSHVLRSASGVWQWRRMLACSHCVRADSRMVSLLLKRLRRRWPTLQWLPVRESHPGQHSRGVIHSHIVCTGLPFTIREKSRAERLCKQHWAAVGGGHMNAQTSKRGNSSAVGHYVGKYVVKGAQESQIAPHCRIWRRTGGFAPEIKMVGYRPPVDLVASGRVDLVTGQIRPAVWSYRQRWGEYMASEVMWADYRTRILNGLPGLEESVYIPIESSPAYRPHGAEALRRVEPQQLFTRDEVDAVANEYRNA